MFQCTRFTVAIVIGGMVLHLTAVPCAVSQQPKVTQSGIPIFAGRWKSDLKATMDFNDKYAKLGDGQRAVLQKVFGRNTLIVEKDTLTVESPAVSFERDGKKYDLDALTETYKYKIIGTTANAVAISTKDNKGTKALAIWHFEDGYIWTYISDSPFAPIHVREYFRRVE